MKSPSPYSNSLFISNYGKAIPYSSSETKENNGRTNYGFKNLKVRPQLIDTIPELSSDNALKALVLSLNLPETNFFSIGCFSGKVNEQEGHLYKGYIEFSFNCRTCVLDARNYFSLYFHFEQFLRQHKFDQKVKFQWMLEEAHFLDVDIDGFSCAIFIFTTHRSSLDEAYYSWKNSLKMLESFLLSVQVRSHTLIYENC
ncbi:MAG: hypothetical protein AAF915_30020 [Cyanobacteria bacterium P01_D01_bin.50]